MVENLIHLKLESREALQLKRDLLTTEMGLLRTAKTIKNYGYFRSEEFKIKLTLQKKIKEVKMNMTQLQKILPKLRVPEILKKEKGTDIPGKQKIRNKPPKEDSLESQLREIQNRLKELQRESI